MIIAGKLLLMAWKVLRMQSDSTRERSEPPPEPETEEFYEDPSDEYVPLEVPEVVFKPAYVKDPKRPVTMFELIDAFEDARREAEIAKERERVREALRSKEPKGKFDNKAHEEDDERTVEAVWERILGLGREELGLEDLLGDDLGINLSVFVSLLHLVRNGFIDVWQDGYPSGAIHVRILPEKDRPAEGREEALS
jgi:segregation and condensation protein A